jgi:hypothetical protein
MTRKQGLKKIKTLKVCIKAIEKKRTALSRLVKYSDLAAITSRIAQANSSLQEERNVEAYARIAEAFILATKLCVKMEKQNRDFSEQSDKLWNKIEDIQDLIDY